MEQDVHLAVQDIVNMAKSKRLNQDNTTVILVSLNRGIETPENQEHIKSGLPYIS